MQKNSTIKNVTGDGNFKELLVFILELENGDTGKIYRKETSPPLEVGQEITYTKNDKGTIKIAFNKEGGNFSSNSDKMTKEDWAKKDDTIIKQTCIKAASEFNAQSEATAKNVIEDATLFYNWVTKGTKKEANNNEDLPF
tara:strand:- start:3005 stop:3424 length:420 start_codon:yes stop_codon:yes gene_type:complete